mmetsp:Transcript_12331/g.20415  ORF Transcript_12331/g.20415 Transcript_12331/m.20415 type:complete len:100 (+) Transcript_12331:72-371(+)
MANTITFLVTFLFITLICHKVDAACETSGYGEDDCRANGCVWCLSGAMPSSCFSAENASKLPAAVFRCDSMTLPELAAIETEKTNLRRADYFEGKKPSV